MPDYDYSIRRDFPSQAKVGSGRLCDMLDAHDPVVDYSGCQVKGDSVIVKGVSAYDKRFLDEIVSVYKSVRVFVRLRLLREI